MSENAVFHDEDAVHLFCDLLIVRDEKNGNSRGLIELHKKIHDVVAIHRVEIPRQLVGKKKLGAQNHGARDRDPLLLSSGELRRTMLQAVPSPTNSRSSLACFSQAFLE